MTDAEYVFEKDCRDKKRIARGSKNRVGLRKGCRLPCDSLTAAQKRKLNGEVTTVNLNRPMSYEHFKTLSADLQAAYIKHLITTFGVATAHIADMMGAKTAILSHYINARNLGITKPRNKNVKKPEEWAKFLAGEYGKPAVEEVKQATEAVNMECAEEMPYKPEPIPQFVPYITSENVRGARLYFRNIECWDQLFNFLKNYPLPVNARVSVIFDEDDGRDAGI